MQRILSGGWLRTARVGLLAVMTAPGLALLAPPVFGGVSYALPAGSAYEKVSPNDKGDGDVWYLFSTVQAAADGQRVTYQSSTSFEGRDAAVVVPTQHLGDLEGESWSTKPIMPPWNDPYGGAFSYVPFGFQAFSANLTSGAVVQSGPALTADAPAKTRNLYTRNFDSDGYQLVTPAPHEPPAAGARVGYAPVVAGTSTDLSHVVFESQFRFLPDAPPLSPMCADFGFGCRANAYVWSGGELSLVGVLPDGSPAPGGAVVGRGVMPGGTAALNNQQFTRRAVSDAGTRVYFTSPATPTGVQDGTQGEIYLRELGRPTVQVSASQRGVPDPGGDQPARFATGARDGSAVVFTSCEKLTDDSTAAATEPDCTGADLKLDLYRYDVESRTLTDLTATLGHVEGILGGDDDLSHVYFATGDAGSGNQIYLWNEGTVIPVGEPLPITSRPRGNAELWPTLITNGQQAAVSRDGRYLTFLSDTPQPGLDTGGRSQVFVFDADTRELTCPSCLPGGGAASADARLRPFQEARATLRDYLSRSINDQGTLLFFQSPEALVPEDVNGKVDVYQYDLRRGGLTLISSGRGTYDAYFGDASADGSEVFFATRNKVIADLDRDHLIDLYVARAGATPHVPQDVAPECVGETCQGPLLASPKDDELGSSVFVGPSDTDEAVTANVFSVKRISTSQAARWARTGRLTLSVRISSGGTVDASAKARVAGKSRVVARGRVRASGGGNVTLTLRLTRAARATLRRTGRLDVAVTVTYSKAEGPQRTTVRLRSASARRSTDRAQSGGVR